jgi:hypothetical protein
MISDHPKELAAPEVPARRFLKLRIGWSVAWVLLTVLLIVLWVRSYSWVEQIVGELPGGTIVGVGLLPGAFGVGISDGTNVTPWTRNGWPAVEWLILVNDSESPYASRVWGMFMFADGNLILPFWLLTITAATSIALPWLRWRFSLRTMLVVTTVIAAVLGMVVWAVR